MDPARLTRLIDRVAESASAPKVIRAYHGSPYDFRRFDASNIGSGEGLQAFGHGLYFADKKSVADGAQYWPHGNQILVDDEPVARNFQLPRNRSTGIPQPLVDAIAMGYVTPREAAAIAHGAPWDEGRNLDNLKVLAERSRDDSVRRGAQSLLYRLDVVPKGHVYEVEIGHPAESLLDWDSAVGSQSEAIARAVERLGGKEALGMRGVDAYRHIGRLLGDAMPTPSVVDSPRAASALLGEGVPGVRYWDGFSRRAGAGTRNYVIFPGAEDQIRILRKYGVLAPMPIVAAVSEGE